MGAYRVYLSSGNKSPNTRNRYLDCPNHCSVWSTPTWMGWYHYDICPSLVESLDTCWHVLCYSLYVLFTSARKLLRARDVHLITSKPQLTGCCYANKIYKLFYIDANVTKFISGPIKYQPVLHGNSKASTTMGNDGETPVYSRYTYYIISIYRGHIQHDNPPHKWPVKLKMFPFDDVIMSRFDAGFAKKATD